MQTHELKTYTKYLVPIIEGKKTFELRKNDRGFRVGDILILKEWDNTKYLGGIAHAEVTYMLDDSFYGLEKGYVIMGIKVLKSNI